MMQSPAKRAVLLMNLGSPDSTEAPDVKRYLTEFLMDGRVIDYPWLFRKILVQGVIVPPGPLILRKPTRPSGQRTARP